MGLLTTPSRNLEMNWKGKEGILIFRLKSTCTHPQHTPAAANKLPKPCEGFQKSDPSSHLQRSQTNKLPGTCWDLWLSFKFYTSLTHPAQSVCSWLITEKSPGECNSPKLALLSYSPFPPSLMLLRKWSLRFIALLMYRFWPMKTFQASLTMGLLCLSREIYCEPAPPEGHLQCSLRLGTLCRVGRPSTIKL